MSINAILKREGIEIIKPLTTLEINKIASSISGKLVQSFPEHNFSQSDLFVAISRLNMYIAKLPEGFSAKYFYKTQSIYFSESINMDDIDTLAVHECIHSLQELTNEKGKLLRLGLYHVGKHFQHGMAINEAAVQTMASIATNCKYDNVKYYNLTMNTISPDYYPIECALLSQMTYFTGSYSLFYSTLFSNDIFKNTFILNSNIETYNKIESNFDLLVSYQDELSKLYTKVSNYDSSCNDSKVKAIYEKIKYNKKQISSLIISTQELIIINCFEKKFQLISNLYDITNFRNSLYQFKDYLIQPDYYEFFTNFYRNMIDRLERKREYILRNGDINVEKLSTTALNTIEVKSFGYNFFNKIFSKFSSIFNIHIVQQ